MSSSTKSDIIASLFSRRSAEDGELDEAYVAHVKIFEEEPGEGLVKARYLMLAGTLAFSISSLTAAFLPG